MKHSIGERGGSRGEAGRDKPKILYIPERKKERYKRKREVFI